MDIVFHEIFISAQSPILVMILNRVRNPKVHKATMQMGITIPKGGHAVAQLVEALRYKPEGRGFDSRWCHWNFSLT